MVSGPPTARPSVTVTDPYGKTTTVEVSPFVIGRETDCDLVVDDPRASRRHAQLEVQLDGRVVLRDLGSASGTFVGDQRLDGGVWFTVPGSFRVGRTVLDVRRTSDAAPVVGAAAAGATVVPANPDTPPVGTAPAVAAAVAAPAVLAAPYATPVAPAAEPAAPASAAAPAPAVLWAAPSALAATTGPARFRSSRTRAMVAMVAIAAAGLLDVASIVHLTGFSQLADDVVSGAAGSAEATAFDATTAGIGGSFVLALIVSGIAYLAWLSRAVENAPALGAGTPRHSPRGAIGWWFVPFANFVVPYQIVSDLHDRLATAVDSDRARPLLLGWWLTWIGGNLIGYVTRFSGTDSIDQLKSAITVTMTSDALNLVAAVLAILVIRRILGRETARAGAPSTPVASDPEPVAG